MVLGLGIRVRVLGGGGIKVRGGRGGFGLGFGEKLEPFFFSKLLDLLLLDFGALEELLLAA